MDSQDATPPTRRKFFKRTAIATLIAGIAAGIGYNAFAHGGGCGDWRGGVFACSTVKFAVMETHLNRMLEHLYVEIDATDTQKARLDPIVKQAVKDLLPIREKMRTARGRAVGLLTADTVERNAIEAFRAEQFAVAEEGSRRIAQAIADVAEVLTPEQRKDLAQRLERHHAWRHG